MIGILISAIVHGLGAMLVWGMLPPSPGFSLTARTLDLDLAPAPAVVPVLTPMENAAAMPATPPVPPPVLAAIPPPLAPTIITPAPVIPAPEPASAESNDVLDSLFSSDDQPDDAVLPPPGCQ